MGGFSKPILHGLCTLGFAVRHLEERYPSLAVQAVKCRFVKHVFPGDLLRTRMWQQSPNKIVFTVSVVEGDGKERLVLSNAAALMKSASKI